MNVCEYQQITSVKTIWRHSIFMNINMDLKKICY